MKNYQWKPCFQNGFSSMFQPLSSYDHLRKETKVFDQELSITLLIFCLFLQILYTQLYWEYLTILRQHIARYTSREVRNTVPFFPSQTAKLQELKSLTLQSIA